MRIRRIFHTFDELVKEFGSRFGRRLSRLMRAYHVRHPEVDITMAMRAASIAWAFVALVSDGDVARAGQFDDMLHGHAAEHVEMNERPLCYEADCASTEECLIWDTTCLMLEEFQAEVEMPQVAYDIACPHALMAYRREVMDEDSTLQAPIKVPKPAKPQAPQPAKQQAAQHQAPKPQAMPQPAMPPDATPQPDASPRAAEPMISLTPSALGMLMNGARQAALMNFVQTTARMGDTNTSYYLSVIEQMKEGMTINITGPIFNNGGTINGDINNPLYVMGKPSAEEKRQLALQCMEAQIKQAVSSGKGIRDTLLPYVAAIRAVLLPNTMSHTEFNTKYGSSISQSSFSEYVPKDIANSHIPEADTEALVKQYQGILEA